MHIDYFNIIGDISELDIDTLSLKRGLGKLDIHTSMEVGSKLPSIWNKKPPHIQLRWGQHNNALELQTEAIEQAGMICLKTTVPHQTRHWSESQRFA